MIGFLTMIGTLSNWLWGPPLLALLVFGGLFYFLGELEKEGINIPFRHMANRAATINFPEMHLDMVRPGTSLYGLYPGQDMTIKPTIDLYPVMAIKACSYKTGA